MRHFFVTTKNTNYCHRCSSEIIKWNETKRNESSSSIIIIINNNNWLSSSVIHIRRSKHQNSAIIIIISATARAFLKKCASGPNYSTLYFIQKDPLTWYLINNKKKWNKAFVSGGRQPWKISTFFCPGIRSPSNLGSKYNILLVFYLYFFFNNKWINISLPRLATNNKQCNNDKNTNP